MTNFEHYYYYNNGNEPCTIVNFVDNMIIAKKGNGDKFFTCYIDDSLFKIYKKWRIVDIFYDIYLRWLSTEYEPNVDTEYTLRIEKGTDVKLESIKNNYEIGWEN